MSEVKVGIIGFGTVGAGTAACLLKNREIIRKRTGADVKLARVADLDITTDRGVDVPREILITDAKQLIRECDIVVELIGGTTVAKTFILEALSQGKPVVTANKALLAKAGKEIFETAEANHVSVHYEASVGGGIPIIKSLREGFAANRINRIYGILNGTCNYILTRMEQENMAFDDVLKDAQRLGYAEANPSLDIDGLDTAHKTAILASLAYGEWMGMDPVFVEGIRNLSLTDIRFAEHLGYKVKLLAILKQAEDGRIEVRVHPTLIPAGKPLAGVAGVFNAVMVNGDFVGDTMFYGRGAGREATASAVSADVVDAALDLVNKVPTRIHSFLPGAEYTGLIPMDEVATRVYMRIPVQDKPGVLGKVATLLSSFGISVAELMQSSPDEAGNVSIILLSHMTREKNVQSAMSELARLSEVTGNVVMIRMEEL